jgi:hypothetical protein
MCPKPSENKLPRAEVLRLRDWIAKGGHNSIEVIEQLSRNLISAHILVSNPSVD